MLTTNYEGGDMYKISFHDGQEIFLHCDQIKCIKAYDFHENKVGKSFEDLENTIEDLEIQRDEFISAFLDFKQKMELITLKN